MTPPIDYSQPWIAIVANPFSGSGPNRDRVDRLSRALNERGLTTQILWDPIDRSALLREAKRMKHCRCVIAAGGDGTLDGVINDCLSVPVATLPLGNENLFAKHFGFRRVSQIAEAVDRNKIRTIDLARANDRLFCIMVGVGLDADVVHRVGRWRQHGDELHRVTRLSYAWPILGSVFNYKYPSLELTVDGQAHHGAHAIVFNFNRYAMSLPFAPHAHSDDGLLHWVVFKKRGIVHLARYMTAVAMGAKHLKMPDVETGSGTRIEITGTKAPIQIDGDPANHTPVTIEAVPRSLRIIDTR